MPEPIIAPNSAPPAPAWHDGLDADVLGAAQLKGWKLDDPKGAFTDAVRAYKGAEAHIGAPADQILRLPKEAGDASWKQVWQRLGAPETPEGYTFDGLKLGDDAATAKFVEGARKLAADLGMPKAHAEGFAQFVAKFAGERTAEGEASYANTLANEKIELAKNWGAEGSSSWETNNFIAKQGAAWAGVDPDTVATLEKAIGYSKVMSLFHKIGVANKEDNFVVNPGGGGGNKPLTREMAVARYSELMGGPPGQMANKGAGDVAWQKRYQEGGTTSTEFRELQDLLMRINA